MTKEQNEAVGDHEFEAKNIFDYLQLALRYVMSGFFGILILAYLVDNHINNHSVIEKNFECLWLLLTISGITGIFIYAIHNALFDRIIYWFMVKIYKKFNKFPKVLDQDLTDWKDTQRLKKCKIISFFQLKGTIFCIASQYALRRTSKNVRVRMLQKDFEKDVSLLMFLYGICYTFIFLPLLFKYIFVSINIIDTRVIELIKIGGIVFVITIIYDYRLTSREIWLIKKYHQS